MYSKLFSSILNSSVWSEDSDTCKVWITLLAMQDREGYVFGSPAGIARIAALPPVVVDAALQKFLSPDPESADLTRAPENEGCRIEIIPGGWRLLNAEHYRDLGAQEERRNQDRKRKARQRERAGVTVTPARDKSHDARDVSRLVPSNPPSDSSSSSSSDSDTEEPPSIPPRGGNERGLRKTRRFRETDVGKGPEEFAADRKYQETVKELSRGALRKMP